MVKYVLSTFHVHTVIHIEVIRQNVFSHAIVMAIGVGSDAPCENKYYLEAPCESLVGKRTSSDKAYIFPS